MSHIFDSLPDQKEKCFLIVLWSGLERLFKEVDDLEQQNYAEIKAERQATGSKVMREYYCGNGDGPNDTLITNDFIWYASAAVCFLALFDKAKNAQGTFRKHFPQMLEFRNKISAHTAHEYPRKHDTPSDQDASLMISPEWCEDHYQVGGMRFAKFVPRDPASAESASNKDRMEGMNADWNWSLTRTHKLIEQYVLQRI